jgi:hypothetical protein
MNDLMSGIQQAIAYEEGYAAGKNAVLDEVEDILDRCAHDNGEMIVRALKELKERLRNGS